MTAARDELIASLWHGEDPFVDWPGGVPDPAGWSTSEHPFLTDTIRELRPRILVEVGVWKGASALAMAREAKRLDLDCVVVAVDTWLGSREHFRRPLDAGLTRRNGYPTVYETFLANVVADGCEQYIVPIPLDSVNASHIVVSAALQVDVIHLDASHDFNSVTLDLGLWWRTLRPGGALIGDDYYTDGRWPDVRRAFDAFFTRSAIEHSDGKCRLYKREAIKPA